MKINTHTILSFLFLSTLLTLASCGKTPVQRLDLSGTWRVQLDPDDLGVEEAWHQQSLSGPINLPGSLAENNLGEDPSVNTYWTGNIWNDSLWYTAEEYAKYRTPDNTKVSFWLTPRKVYYGPAWYQRSITIPEAWAEQQVTLHLERPHWETTVWLDDQELGEQDYLATPHTYALSADLTPGEHTLTIRVDNRVKDIEVGLDAHSVTDNTQSNWNGIVGDIALVAKPRVHIASARIFPDVAAQQVLVRIAIDHSLESATEATLKIQAQLKEDPMQTMVALTQDITLQGNDTLEITYPMGDDFFTWDEFNPDVYQLEVELTTESSTDRITEDFGMRDFKAIGQRFEINGRPVFLRGTLECAIFPLTGYPPTTTPYWVKIFQALQDHGLNHMRFHSWCPPEAAFEAADSMGIYLQVEASVWTYLGDGKPIDAWVYKETENILQEYGNHPSFVMLTHGNEPRGDSLNAFLNGYLAHFQAQDPTKVYAPASGWPYLEQADYYLPFQPRLHRWNEGLNSKLNQDAPTTDFDFQEFSAAVDQPIVSHEIGQWCVFPDFSALDKFNGILEPRNFEIFQETLVENDLDHLADSFLLASGKLQTLCYKADIEAALRTQPFGGFQLLDLHDFPGQGTALVGVLDALWEEKGYVTPEEFRAFCGPTTPLVRLPKRYYTIGDTLKAQAEVAHFGQAPLTDTQPHWEVTTTAGDTIALGKLAKTDISLGNAITLSDIIYPVTNVNKSQKLTLHLSVGEATNNWDFWVYPKELPTSTEGNIPVISTLDPALIADLQAGGKAILQISRKDLKTDQGGDIEMGFTPIFWNTSWTSGQAPHTLGLLCQTDHPALAEFPTEFHSNWQWWEPISSGAAIVIDDLDRNIKPIVRVIDDWFENRSLALIFEVKIGAGRLIVAGVDLTSDLDERPVVRQLRYSLERYLNGPSAEPVVAIEAKDIQALLQ